MPGILRSARRHCAAGALSVLALGALPAAAQQTPSPAPRPSPTPAHPTPTPAPTAAPTPIVQPLPGQEGAASTAAPIALPTLGPAQEAELAGLLRERYVTQGLRYSEPPLLPERGPELVRAALDYAQAVRTGRLAPEDFQSDWGLRPTPYDPLPDFAAAVREDRLSQWIRSLPPPYSGYDALRDGLARYRAIEAAGGWEQVASGETLREGDTDPRVDALRKRLAVEDDQIITVETLTAEEQPDPNLFDTALTEAVKRAQTRYGLAVDGVVGPNTLAAINTPVGERIRQIMANMERWRWIPRQLPVHRVQVNIAATVLTLFEGDRPVGSMKVVTGQPGHETPMLSSTIHSIVLNPPWNVPSSIAANELWPKERRNPGYLARNDFRVIELGNGRTRLQQRAGPKSALGRYKFDFDNPYAVYLHDTPAQATFDRVNRLASHGCIRLARPAALARLLLADNPDWEVAKINETIASGDTVRADLKTPVEVFLLYWTAYVGSEGTMYFLNDPYGWDAVLADKIESRAQAQQVADR
ncbi:L,D-transpeptidase family protein [Stakelama tenebrarum]|uniref:L,D-transpeptidase family protein n=1 Tax=Stakelama tenebrarum TaxID=2711215 RepID=A0A6G6Y4E2_9SPHN|nr:L,D-transpeptidase family protein [Sphingosinithalassobacter tenebrarum]QIG79770.1 L,D-transpeptidase family protein [Sphingosinithalassobacter tenebrarum]